MGVFGENGMYTKHKYFCTRFMFSYEGGRTTLTQIVNNYLCCFPFSPIMHAFKVIQPSPGNFSYFLHHSNYLFCVCTVQPLNGMTIQSGVKLICMYGFKCSSDFVKEYSICPVLRKKSKKNHLLPIHNVFSSTMNYSL